MLDLFNFATAREWGFSLSERSLAHAQPPSNLTQSLPVKLHLPLPMPTSQLAKKSSVNLLYCSEVAEFFVIQSDHV